MKLLYLQTKNSLLTSMSANCHVELKLRSVSTTCCKMVDSNMTTTMQVLSMVRAIAMLNAQEASSSSMAKAMLQIGVPKTKKAKMATVVLNLPFSTVTAFLVQCQLIHVNWKLTRFAMARLVTTRTKVSVTRMAVISIHTEVGTQLSTDQVPISLLIQPRK